MKIYYHPERKEWDAILQRPVLDSSSLKESVGSILKDIKARRDVAIQEYSLRFDGVSLETLLVSEAEFEEAHVALSEELKAAIQVAHDNIFRFHEAQVSKPQEIETMPGVVCVRKSVGIEKVGLYIPGGTAPLFSTVLMLGIPAKIAVCKQVILCTPPNKEGKVHPAILYSAKLAGVHQVYKVGGIQAIGGMAYGTDTIPKVFKIFGPGNQYVTAAKQMVNAEGVAIDMPAGPSEVMVIADETAHAGFVAADLLSQAEHGADSQVVLVAVGTKILEAVLKELDSQVALLPRRGFATQALGYSVAIIVENTAEAMAISNEYAPEHLILATADADLLAQGVTNAGSVFIGHYSPESVGDYASGTNHTLPTNGYAKAYSGVSLDSFVKKITFQRLTREGLESIGQTVITMAKAEHLDAHARAVEIRLENKIS